MTTYTFGTVNTTITFISYEDTIFPGEAIFRDYRLAFSDTYYLSTSNIAAQRYEMCRLTIDTDTLYVGARIYDIDLLGDTIPIDGGTYVCTIEATMGASGVSTLSATLTIDPLVTGYTLAKRVEIYGGVGSITTPYMTYQTDFYGSTVSATTLVMRYVIQKSRFIETGTMTILDLLYGSTIDTCLVGNII